MNPPRIALTIETVSAILQKYFLFQAFFFQEKLKGYKVLVMCIMTQAKYNNFKEEEKKSILF